MSNYTKNTNFTAKDTLTSGDPAKVIKGAEFDTEFNSIQTAVNSKADSNNSQLTGTTDAQAVETTGDVTVGGNLSVTGNATIEGNLTFGNADTDTVSFVADVDSSIIPDDDNTYDLGSATKQWRNVYVDGTANIDSLVADTADINGGTIDGVSISGSTASFSGEISANGGIALGDNDKATFGASDDLQIYHDGSNSWIQDLGAGSLILKSDGTYTSIQNSAGNDQVLVSSTDVKLANSGNTKLATTATGVDVTGTVTADGLTVSGTENLCATLESTHVGGNARLFFRNEGNASEFNIGYNNNGRFTLYDANTSRSPLEVETSGVVSMDFGIATSDITPTDAGNVRIKKSGQNVLLRVMSDAANTAGLDIGTHTDPDKHRIRSVPNSNDLQIVANNSERMRFRDGKVGINTSDPQQALDVNGRSVFRNHLEVGLNTGGVGLTFNDGGGNANLVFNHTAMMPDQDGNSGRIRVNTDDATNASMDFQIATGVTGGVSKAMQSRYSIQENKHVWNKSETNATEAMRIDSSGNLLVGTTNADIRLSSDSEGVAIQNDRVTASRASGASADFNRFNTDGAIAQFRKNGALVGSIGAKSNDLTIGTGHTGLKFVDQYDMIQPINTTGADRDGAISLGYTGQRFKDLYLSGGVYLGGTGAANKLDDYEEGDWTPVFGYSSTNGTGSWTYTVQEGKYTKVGNLVYFFAEVRFGSFTKGSASGAPVIIGLPFTSGGQANGEHYFVNFSGYNTPLPTTAGHFTAPQVAGNSTRINLYAMRNNTTFGAMPDPDSDTQYKISGMYRTNS